MRKLFYSVVVLSYLCNSYSNKILFFFCLFRVQTGVLIFHVLLNRNKNVVIVNKPVSCIVQGWNNNYSHCFLIPIRSFRPLRWRTDIELRHRILLCCNTKLFKFSLSVVSKVHADCEFLLLCNNCFPWLTFLFYYTRSKSWKACLQLRNEWFKTLIWVIVITHTAERIIC